MVIIMTNGRLPVVANTCFLISRESFWVHKSLIVGGNQIPIYKSFECTRTIARKEDYMTIPRILVEHHICLYLDDLFYIVLKIKL